MISKVNLALSITKKVDGNFFKVEVGLVEEPVEHETTEQLQEGIRRNFALLRAEMRQEVAAI